ELSVLYLFFFSSRRRHTRSKRDWSSDVCSSDLHTARQVTKVGNTRSRWPNPFGEEPSKVGPVIGTKSEQGSRTGRCGWITSFLRRFTYLIYIHSITYCCY